MPKLEQSIKNMYQNLLEQEACSAANNLIGFFKVLEQIDSRLSKNVTTHKTINENIRNTSRPSKAQ